MRARTFTLRFLLLAVVALFAVACGSDDTVDAGGADDTTSTSQPDDTTDDSEPDDTDPGIDEGEAGGGTITVRLEEVQGFFIEGFEVGLRFEQIDGTVLSTWRWNDVVEQFGDGTAVAAYETVLEESVPAGRITVLATVNLGLGPPPEVPDLDGPMDCRVTVEVPADGRVDIEVDFSGTADCIREVS